MSRFQTASRQTLILAALLASAASAQAANTPATTPDAAAPPAAAGPTVAIQPLTKYKLPDGTASVMLPDGWRVTQTGIGFIRAEGPKGELAMFGVTVPVHDGQGGSAPPAPLEQPYSAEFGEKLNQTIQWERAANHLTPVRVTHIYSNDTFTAPKEMGTCSKITANVAAGRAVLDAEADLCSMPMDKAGNYTNFLKIIAISPALAKAERSTLEASLASYVVNIKAVQKQTAAAAKQAPKMSASNMSGGGMSGGGMMSGNGMSARPSNGRVTPQSLQQQINSEVQAAGLSPQMVAAMRVQANQMAMAQMGPALRASQAATQAADYFDRTELRGQIPLAYTNQGTFWLDPN